MKTKAFALTSAALLAFTVQSAFSQDKPKPPPAWHQGKPAAMAESKLAPVPGKMTETPAAEIPLDKLKLPKGFKAEIWASGLVGGRAMTMNDDQTRMWVGTRAMGRIYEVSIEGGKTSHKVLVDKLLQPTAVFANGALYVFAIDKVLRYDNAANGAAGQPVDMTAVFRLPPEQHHNWKYVRLGPDKKLYVPFGAPCNICEVSKEYAQIRRYNLDGSGMEVIATGVRNTVGFDFHPKTGELWFTDHGRDWMGDEGPEDELNRLSKPGQNFGFPYCHAKGVVDPDVAKGKKDACKGVTLPVTTMGPHAAVMGLQFYTGTMFPKEYQGLAFVARKGSWNRTNKFGYDVVTVKASPDGKGAKVTPFATGFMDPKDNSFWGRPAYLAQLKDGSLLVSDEQLGAIYRISYSAPAPAKKN
ncbi:MAG: sorbosone dehydrogenase family protein [Betaproteobacteria bacterium]|nr:sorbosone dehydrogenase family protein [Betaproteobacteria bacterium]